MHAADYLQILGTTRDSRFGSIKSPRQTGKTLTVAACVFAVMVACPGITVGLYASKLGQATIMFKRIEAFFHQYSLPVSSNQTDCVREHPRAGALTCARR